MIIFSYDKQVVESLIKEHTKGKKGQNDDYDRIQTITLILTRSRLKVEAVD